MKKIIAQSVMENSVTGPICRRTGIDWNDWNRSDGCKYHMDRTSFNNVSFTNIFYTAMHHLQDSFRRPSGSGESLLWGKFKPLMDTLGTWGFDKSEAPRRINEGKFNFKWGKSEPMIEFQGPTLPSTDWGVYRGKDERGLHIIEINFYQLVDFANRNPIRFPRNNTGVFELAILTGAVVLHEMLHAEGYSHVDYDPNNDPPNSDYNRSFPEMAGQAFGEVYIPGFIYCQGHLRRELFVVVQRRLKG